MPEKHFETLRAIFRPWYVKAASAAFTVLGGYDVISNQFPSLPKLQAVIGMSGAVMPWWGWLLALQSVFVLGLFDYVRRNIVPLSGGKGDEKDAPSDALAMRNEIGAAESRADQALARHAQLNAEDQSKYLRSKAAIEERLGNLEADIEDIKGQIAVDLPNAKTVVQAYGNLDQAMHNKVRRFEEVSEKIGETARRADQDTLFLLDWAAARSSANVIQELARQQPKLDKANPPADESEREIAIRGMQDWIGSVASGITDVNYNGEIDRVLRSSRYEGEGLARQVPANQRPTTVDVLVFADFFALAHQCEMTGICLRNVVLELEKSDRFYLNRFRGQLRARKT